MKYHPGLLMHVDMAALRQQMWRAERTFVEFNRYARSIGCKVVGDEIMCVTEVQERQLARWWTEHCND